MIGKATNDYDWVSATCDANELTVTVTLAEYISMLRRSFEDAVLIFQLRAQVREQPRIQHGADMLPRDDAQMRQLDAIVAHHTRLEDG